jgi:hypothetical protein
MTQALDSKHKRDKIMANSVNIKRCIYHTYAWFIGEHYGMNLEFGFNADMDKPLEPQIRENMRWQEAHNYKLKNREIAGHVLNTDMPATLWADEYTFNEVNLGG